MSKEKTVGKSDKVDNSKRDAKLGAALDLIHKKYGKESVYVLGKGQSVDVDSISTGSLMIDRAIGIGGLPIGRVIEIYGPESSGKTTLTLETIAQAQKKGLLCAFIDAEHALDTSYAEALGVDLDALVISQPDNAEQALNIVEDLVASNIFGLVILDSVAALSPKAEIDGEMGDHHVGLIARLMGQALRKVTGVAKKNNCTVVFINQIRHKIGVMFGSPETTTGGNALKFYSSVRIDIRRTGAIKDGDNIVGNETKVKIVKNKVSPPFKEALTSIVFGAGFDYMSELVDLAVEFGAINKTGAWYSYGDVKVGQGKSNAVAFLLNPDNSKILSDVKDIVHTSVGIK